MVTSFAITHTTLHTGDAAGTVLEDRTVVVGADGRITSVAPADQTDLPPGMLRLDGRGKHLLQGLINAHAHLFADGRPLADFSTDPRVTKLTTRVLRSPVGRQLLLRRTRQNALTQLRSGVTTLRTVGDVWHEVIETRDAIEAGRLVGPGSCPRAR